MLNEQQIFLPPLFSALLSLTSLSRLQSSPALRPYPIHSYPFLDALNAWPDHLVM